MNLHEELIEIMRKYGSRIRTSFDFHIKGNIPSKKIDNAIKTFANGLDRTTIIGFYDTTVMGSGKSGYIFTTTKVYYHETMSKPKKLWYDDIERMELFRTHKKDCNMELCFYLNDGSELTWDSTFLNKTPLFEFFNELLEKLNTKNTESFDSTGINYGQTDYIGAKIGGIAYGNYETVNKGFDEERFHARQGHGFAAERANNLYDNLRGHNAKIVGDDNVKNGADRIVDGVYIQSKYCKTGSRCVNECFEYGGKGDFRYYTNDGKPMKIEVPSDKYNDAVRAMEEKIRRGQVKGVSDPSEASKIIRKGHITYEQAKNIAEAGTVESLAYDAVNGAIIASSAFGVTAVISFATSVWNGEDFDQALKVATYSGLKVGGTAFITSIVAAQLSKMGLNSALVKSSEAMVRVMGPKVSAMISNAFRSGSNIYGIAAMKSAAKLLRGNVITAGVTVVVMSSFDIVNIFRNRISGKQLFKNLANTATTVAAGTGGWIAGAAIGSFIPVVGTVIGGLIGSVVAGSAAGKATDKVLGTFIEDDANEMVTIIEEVFTEKVSDYLLNQKETEKSVDQLRDVLTGKILKDMFASEDRNGFAVDIIEPIIETQVLKRKIVKLPTYEQMINAMEDFIGEAS